MSIKSDYTTINTLKQTYSNTHSKRNYKDLMNSNIYMDNPNNNLNMMTRNQIENKLCSINSSKFGEISGCSIKPNTISKNPIPDYIARISDDSFMSQFLPIQNTHYINNKNNNNNKNIMGFEDEGLYKISNDNNRIAITSLNELNTLDENDIDKEYCYDKYQNIFGPSL